MALEEFALALMGLCGIIIIIITSHWKRGAIADQEGWEQTIRTILNEFEGARLSTSTNT